MHSLGVYIQCTYIILILTFAFQVRVIVYRAGATKQNNTSPHYPSLLSTNLSMFECVSGSLAAWDNFMIYIPEYIHACQKSLTIHYIRSRIMKNLSLSNTEDT